MNKQKKIMRSTLFFFFSLCISISANSASFNCDMARGFVETTICSDTNLSKLDTNLFRAYKKAIIEAEEPAKLQQQQRAWLTKSRAICTNIECLKNAYTTRIQEIKSVKKFYWKIYSDKKLGVEFSYPSNRTVSVVDRNSLRLHRPATPHSDYIIELQVGTGGFKKAINESAIFEKIDDQWVAIIGPSANSPAESISGKNWHGIKSIITCGTSDEETGFHAAGGQCLWAVISDGKRYLVANTMGILGPDDLTLKTLMSIKFLSNLSSG